MAAFKVRGWEPRSIVQIALDVHSTALGSYVRGDDSQEEDIKILTRTLEDWDPSISNFEAAVKMLIEAALEDALDFAAK